ncbi:MAG: hypothetical protein V2I97_11495 [Desulfococcaceae bacterium]|jgi:hypothetical protein|nr:hypothetical protein [Desulfococcaceae bacterium]
MTHYEIRKGDDNIQDKMTDIDRHVSTCVYVNNNKSFLKKLFPDKRQRENAEHDLRLARTEFDFREKALGIARDAQLQAIQEMYNDYLVRGKIPIRRERAEFVLEQKMMLENRVSILSQEFETSLMKNYEQAEKIHIPSLKSRKMQMLDDTIDEYFNLVDQLRNSFKEILDEGVEY